MRISFFLTTLLVSFTAAQRQCYDKEGNLAPELLPCGSSSGDVGCCRPTNDICLENGLCYSPGLNAVSFRGCTDKTGNSSACFQQCKTTKPEGAVFLTPCGGTMTFCCGLNTQARACCDQNNGTIQINRPGNVQYNQYFLPPNGTLLSSGNGTCTSNIVVTSTATVTSAASNGASAKNSNNLPLGLGVGLGVGIPVALALAGLGFWLGKRSGFSQRAGRNHGNGLSSSGPKMNGPVRRPDDPSRYN